MFETKAEDGTPFPHKEITEAIIGGAFEVYNHLGYGFSRARISAGASGGTAAAWLSDRAGKANHCSLQERDRWRIRCRLICRRFCSRRNQSGTAIRQTRRSAVVERAKSNRHSSWTTGEFWPRQG